MEGHPVHPDQTLERIRELKKGQHPFAVIVSCSDSRVPPEVIFDQGLGDIFSVRTAGNVIGDYELGSIEYAVEHLGCQLIIVLGHEQCGAVSAFLQHESDTHHDHIQSILHYLESEPEEKALPDSLKHSLYAAIQANILHGRAFASHL
jgi:Carbonic anhydrase